MTERDGFGSSVSAWTDLVRLPNLPTVWTNKIVGVVLGVEAVRHAVRATSTLPTDGYVGPSVIQQGLREGAGWFASYWPMLWPVLVPVSLIYLGGMAMHDWCDAPRDAAEKPSRPIVRGGITRRSAAGWAAMGLGLGLVLLLQTGLTLGVFGCVLVGLIVAYNLTHHRWFGSIVLLGLIRGWLIFGVAWCVVGVEGWRSAIATALPIAVVMTVYVTLVSVVARGEDGSDGTPAAVKAVAKWIVPLALVSLLWVGPRQPLAWGMAAGCGAMLLLWLIGADRRVAAGQRGPAVGMYLGGITLVDAYTLALLGRPGLSAIALGLFGVALGLQRWRTAGRAT
ncbi:MAG: UbiA family prenyltransferase [Planctomycetota bacterium]